jgi:hypothetical protein
MILHENPELAISVMRFASGNGYRRDVNITKMIRAQRRENKTQRAKKETNFSRDAGTTSPSPIGWERAGVRARVRGKVSGNNPDRGQFFSNGAGAFQ